MSKKLEMGFAENSKPQTRSGANNQIGKMVEGEFKGNGGIKIDKPPKDISLLNLLNKEDY